MVRGGGRLEWGWSEKDNLTMNQQLRCVINSEELEVEDKVETLLLVPLKL
jgi:hypothetical protein